MLTFISFLFIIFLVQIKKVVSFYIFLFGFSLVCFSIALDGAFIGLWEHMYVYARVEPSILNVYYWFILLLGFLIFSFNLKSFPSKFKNSDLSISKIILCARMISLISLFACIVNTYKAWPISNLFVHPRVWEIAFGSNVFLNYLYFLHLPALSLFSIVVYFKKTKLIDFLLIALLLFSSFLHGIKFTIIHAFLFFIIGLILLNDEKIPKRAWLLILILFSSIIVFFTFVRGGGILGFLDYITSASVNSMFIINNSGFLDISSPQILNPFSFLPIDKIYYRLILGSHLIFEGGSNFYLNPKYNLQHGITRVGYAFGFAFIFYSYLFSLLINFLRLSSISKFHHFIFLKVIILTLIMLFTGFEFYKTKLWFVMFFSYILYYLMLRKKKADI